jgi:hypothetical protein
MSMARMPRLSRHSKPNLARATLLIREHGEDAEIVASQRADLMLDRGDRDGHRVWLRIGRAITELQEAPTGRVH